MIFNLLFLFLLSLKMIYSLFRERFIGLTFFSFMNFFHGKYAQAYRIKTNLILQLEVTIDVRFNKIAI